VCKPFRAAEQGLKKRKRENVKICLALKERRDLAHPRSLQCWARHQNPCQRWEGEVVAEERKKEGRKDGLRKKHVALSSDFFGFSKEPLAAGCVFP